MLPSGVSIYLALAPVDLRKGFELLAGLVHEHLRGDARSGDLFVFLNRPRTRLKCLFFDKTGYCVLYKRLDRGTFHVPVVTEPNGSRVEVDAAQLELMLEGLELPEDRRPAKKRPPRIH